MSGTHTVTTISGTENDTLSVNGDLTTGVSANNISETTTVLGGFHENNYYDTHTAINTCGGNVELDVGYISASFNLILMFIELKLWQHHDIHGVAHFDVHALLHNDIHIGPHLTIDVAGTLKIHDAPDIQLGTNSTLIKALLLAL